MRRLPRRLSAVSLAVAATLLGSACSVTPNRVQPPQYFDFGAPHRSSGLPCCARQLALEPVEYAPMLATTTMWYREGAASVQPRAFAFSRWSAEPAALLEQHVRVRLAVAEAEGQGRLPYRLNLRLETMEQVFPDAGPSEVRLTVGVALIRSADRSLVGSRVFSLAEADVERSPLGGAEALSRLVADFAEQLQAWACAQVAACAEDSAQR